MWCSTVRIIIELNLFDILTLYLRQLHYYTTIKNQIPSGAASHFR
jgi:hypothetical protein